MKRLQAAARYLCYKLNEMEGKEVIPPDAIESQYENSMVLDDEEKANKKNLIPKGYEGKILDIAFDDRQGNLWYMNKGLSDSFVRKYKNHATKQTQSNISAYFAAISKPSLTKKDFCRISDQDKRAREYLKELANRKDTEKDHASRDKTETERILDEKILEYEKDLEDEGVYNLVNAEDARDRIFRSIAYRRGQEKFREMLLINYDSTCPITGTQCSLALEAAHILPYNGGKTNIPSNGMPLRADIHVLFDLKLITIDNDYKINVAEELKGTAYASLSGKELRLPKDSNVWPSRILLKKHREGI